MIEYPAPGFGWLARDPDAPNVVEGVEFDGTLPTRREEYNLLANAARHDRDVAWDAATGFIPNWHVAPYILAKLGYFVYATDHNPEHMAMPAHPEVKRFLHDLNDPVPIEDGGVDLTCCISVLEHVHHATRASFAREAARVTYPGGLLVVTADDFDPVLLAAYFSDDFDVGELHPDQSEHLTPRVGYVIGRRVVR